MAPLIFDPVLASPDNSIEFPSTNSQAFLRVSDPLCALSSIIHNHELTLHLGRKKNGNVVFKLSSPSKVYFEVKATAAFLTNELVKKGNAKKRKNNHTKKKKQKTHRIELPMVDHFDWKEYLDMMESQAPGLKKSRRKRRKRSSKRKYGDEKVERKEKRKYKSSGSRGKHTTKSEDADPCSSTEPSTTNEAGEIQPFLNPATIESTPFVRRVNSAWSSSSQSFPICMNRSDLPNSFTSERSKRGGIKVHAISLDNPMLSVQGTIFAGNSKKLRETLKGGAFVYSSNQQERKWHQTFRRIEFRLKLNRTNSSSMSSSSSTSRGFPTATANSLKNDKYLQFDPNATESNHCVEIQNENENENADASSSAPRLHTLSQIQELEAFDDDQSDGYKIYRPPREGREETNSSSFEEDCLWSLASETQKSRSWFKRFFKVRFFVLGRPA